nr:ribonuclease H-like domain-containing protein [Tanacetum cinerariifolium]
MLEEMARISLDNMLVKWHRISKGLMHGRMGLQTKVELVMLLLLGLRVLELGIKPSATTAEDWTQLLIAQKEEAGIQLQAEEFDFIAAVGDLDEIEEVNANCILMTNL